MLNGLEFVSYLIEARKVNLLIKRHPPNDCTFLVSEIGLGRSNHHAFLSRVRCPQIPELLVGLCDSATTAVVVVHSELVAKSWP